MTPKDHESVQSLASLIRNSLLTMMAGNSAMHLIDPETRQSIGFIQAIHNRGLRGIAARHGIIIGFACCRQGQEDSHRIHLDEILEQISDGDLKIEVTPSATTMRAPGVHPDMTDVPGTCYVIGFRKSTRVDHLIGMQWTIENAMSCPHSAARPTPGENEATADFVNPQLQERGLYFEANPYQQTPDFTSPTC